MAVGFEMKRNDLRPYYRVTLTQTLPDGTKAAVDLTNATAAKFSMKPSTPAGAAVKVNRGDMTFVDKPNGIVQYQWKSGDTDTSNTYSAEVEVLWGTDPQSFPSSSYFVVSITDDVA